MFRTIRLLAAGFVAGFLTASYVSVNENIERQKRQAARPRHPSTPGMIPVTFGLPPSQELHVDSATGRIWQSSGVADPRHADFGPPR